MEAVIPKEYKALVEHRDDYKFNNIQLVLNLGEKIDFEPGQYVMLVAKIDGVVVKRCYSIWCRYGNSIILMIEMIGGGTMTTFIYDHLHEDAYIKVIGPMGLMTIQNKKFHKCFISTGTGVVPFSCMIDKLLDDPTSWITLIAGFKYHDDAEFLQMKRLCDISKYHPQFAMYMTYTREKGYSKVYNVRVNKLFSIAFDDYEPPYKDTEFYICGLKDMIDDMKEELNARGVSEELIITEQYN